MLCFGRNWLTCVCNLFHLLHLKVTAEIDKEIIERNAHVQQEKQTVKRNILFTHKKIVENTRFLLLFDKKQVVYLLCDLTFIGIFNYAN